MFVSPNKVFCTRLTVRLSFVNLVCTKKNVCLSNGMFLNLMECLPNGMLLFDKWNVCLSNGCYYSINGMFFQE